MRLDALAIAISAVLTFAADGASAEPMDLRDPSPRAVSVRFENSPSDAPSRLGETFTLDIPARFEIEPGSGFVRVSVAGADVERRYFTRQRLREGSFSDYVWTFDPKTRHVVSASLRGTFIRRFDFGLFDQEIDTPFEATLSTLRSVGFATARRMFGQLLFPLCEVASSDCTLVPPARYDESTGYVNAVGWIGARALGVSARSFASIGEAIFTESMAPGAAGYATVR